MGSLLSIQEQFRTPELDETERVCSENDIEIDWDWYWKHWRMTPTWKSIRLTGRTGVSNTWPANINFLPFIFILSSFNSFWLRWWRKMLHLILIEVFASLFKKLRLADLFSLQSAARRALLHYNGPSVKFEFVAHNQKKKLSILFVWTRCIECELYLAWVA